MADLSVWNESRLKLVWDSCLSIQRGLSRSSRKLSRNNLLWSLRVVHVSRHTMFVTSLIVGVRNQTNTANVFSAFLHLKKKRALIWLFLWNFFSLYCSFYSIDLNLWTTFYKIFVIGAVRTGSLSLCCSCLSKVLYHQVPHWNFEHIRKCGHCYRIHYEH